MAKTHCFNIVQNLFQNLSPEEIDYVKKLTDRVQKVQNKEEAKALITKEFDDILNNQKNKLKTRLMSIEAKNNVVDTIEQIKAKGAGFKYDEREAIISFAVGDNKHVNKFSISSQQEHLANQVVADFNLDLEKEFQNEMKVLRGNGFLQSIKDVAGKKNEGAIKLDNDIRIELGELNIKNEE